MLDKFRETAITWDKANRKVYEQLRVSAGDNKGRKLSVQVVNGGVIESLSGASLSLFWETKDKAHNGLDAFETVDAAKGEFEIYYKTGMLSNEGALNANLVLVDTNGRVVSEPFTITVFKGIDDDAIQSSDSFTALTEALVQVGNINNKADRDELLALESTFEQTKVSLEQQLQHKTNRSEVLQIVGDVSDGTPLFADDVSGMTDVARNYVNGSDGFIYTYDGSGWVNTNVKYQTTGIGVKDIKLLNMDIDGYLPQPLFYEYGRETGTDNRYVHSDVSIAKKGTKISTSRNDIRFTLYYLSGSTYRTVFSGWVTDYVLLSDVSDLRIVARFEPLRTITESEKVAFSNSLVIATEETAVKKKEMDATIRTLGDGDSLPYELGDITVAGVNSTNTTARIRSKEFSFFQKGTTFRNTDKENLQMAIAVEGGTYFLTNRGWTSADYTLEDSANVRIMLRKVDGTVFTSQEIESYGSKIEIYTPNHLVKQKNLRALINETVQIGSTTKYISTSGSDTNDGNAKNTAYATLQKALNERPKNIAIERGTYRNQSAVKNDIDDISIFAYGSGDKAVFVGSDRLTGWEPYNDIYRTAYAGNTRYQQVFVDKTLPIDTGGNRPSFNAVLWEGNDKKTDYKMTPVLTVSECVNTLGTFHFDGTYVYVNPADIANEFNAVKTDTGLVLSGNKVKLQDIVFDFYTNDPMLLDNVESLDAQNCEANHSSTRDGWSLDRTSGVLRDCKGIKNRNDGFNLHFNGDTQLINCEGTFNYDDGVSHHEECTGTIVGGRWSDNGKGGVAPAYGAKVNVYNAVIENNDFGFYNMHETPIDNISSGNLYRNNNTTFRNAGGGELLSINDKFVSEGTLYSGEEPTVI